MYRINLIHMILYTKLIIKQTKIDYQNHACIVYKFLKEDLYALIEIMKNYPIIYKITYFNYLLCIRLMLLKYMANSMINKLLIYPSSRIYILIKIVFESIRVTVMLMHYTHFECLIIYLITS